MKIVSNVFIPALLSLTLLTAACGSTSKTGIPRASQEPVIINASADGTLMNLSLTPGKHHNYPSFVVWAETTDGQFIQTLFVTQSVGTGYYGHGSLGTEKWDKAAGPQSRPASLPYWLHKRLPGGAPLALPTPEKPVPDAYTGATPPGAAEYVLKSDQTLPQQVRILFEVNQPWDWNEYWHTTRFDDADYRTSCQPSLVYAVTVDLRSNQNEYHLNPIGHGHFAGQNGQLYTDLRTLTTAKDIFSSIHLTIIKNQ